MVNYNLGKIYRIISEEGGVQYIGSSAQKLLSKRMGDHRRDYNAWRAAVKHNYCSSYEVLRYEDYKIELLETFPCNSKAELEARENHWQRKMKNTKDEFVVVNQVMAGATTVAGGKKKYMEEYMKEYRENNSETIAEKDKKRYENNKETINERRKKKIRCEVCDCEIRRDGKTDHEKTNKHKKNLLKK